MGERSEGMMGQWREGGMGERSEGRREKAMEEEYEEW